MSSSNAQWKNISAGKIPNASRFNPVGSSLIYRNGIIWLGHGMKLWGSSDFGGTWFDRTPSGLSEEITDIDFYDATHGAIATYFHIFVTNDGGTIWNSTTNAATQRTVRFIANGSELISRTSSAIPIISRDGGTTWLAQNAPTSVTLITEAKGDHSGNIYILGWSDQQSAIYSSSDYGLSWNRVGSSFDKDCWSYNTDPCNGSNMVVVNEESYSATDYIAGIYSSTNGGTSWTFSDATSNRNYFCGSISIVPNVFFVQTLLDGILRSTDFGNSWSSINGPNGLIDSRLVTAVSADTIIAADALGNVWMTINSGGSPMPESAPGSTFTISADTLFQNVRISECDSSDETLYISVGGCIVQSLTKEIIQGSAMNDYTIVSSSNDSIIIRFKPTMTGIRSAELTLKLSDGSLKIVELAGTGKPALPLKLVTIPLCTTDTIGGNIRIPIRVIGLVTPQTVEFTISFDRDLHYLGSTSAFGTSVDVAGTTLRTSSRLRVPATELLPDSICAYANFNVFIDSSSRSAVVVSALDLPSDMNHCEYLENNTSDTTNVIGPSGCGVRTINNFLRDTIFPKFSVYPNPSNGHVTMESNIAIRTLIVSLSNVVGMIVMNTVLEADTRKSVDLDLSRFSNGLYFLRIVPPTFDKSFPLLLQK
ncbi:MAG TPA: T9SS type A sorting domain-containing protein [Candidatus Kapabacteria bacterium]|nr:T9SS type A sorting domain-containing protein [Candidatus Kapabacteria bacterium]